MPKIVKLLIVAVVLYFAWTKGLPRLKALGSSSSTTTSASGSASTSCPDLAARASETWGSGLSRFVNPPVDVNEWQTFRSSVQSRIDEANDACRCSEPACDKTREAMSKLESLVSSVDGAIRGGGPMPSDAPQQQEQIDQGIDAAREMARSSK
ncbi:MAG TPA: hypothetical protein VHL58_19775 [Thermoanaerobaculia bacterium]|nr:hypothetical protein [Thermoanaerobaculia bacterium]